MDSESPGAGSRINARVYQQLRSAHLERAHLHTPATMLYVERNYDFESGLAEGLQLIRAGTFGAPAHVLRSRYRAIEVNEPLMRQRLGRTVLTVWAARLAGRVHRQPVLVVAHAIENRDPFEGPPPASPKSRARRLLDEWLSRRLARGVDRLSFGTPAARDLYLDTRGRELRTASTQLILELPAPCDCAVSPSSANAGRVAFVGAFDERKGIRPLLAAWPSIKARLPAASLLVVGKGPLAEEVVAAAALLADVEVILDPPRSKIHEVLSGSQVLVLLSQARARWREQVGLPIVEGLSHGCTVVTTDQTGLAPWLAEHGHVVVRADASAATVADAVVAAISSSRAATDVLADLPTIDGRTAADRWLFRPMDVD